MKLFSLGANTSWFTFATSIVQTMPLSVYSFSGKETLNEPFAFEIELVSRSSELHFDTYIGKEGLLTINDRSGKTRHVHGFIRQISYQYSRNNYSHYRCSLVPRLWFLSETQDHKIYQGKTVIEIIEDVLRKHTFTEGSYSFKLREKDKYPVREYCVQYGESDLHFLTRLCEEEGIYYFFEHTDNSHCLCFSDAPDGPGIPGESTLLFHSGIGSVPDTAVVSTMRLTHRVNSNACTYKEWNFTKPSLPLLMEDRETEWAQAPTPSGTRLETYQHPHLYQTQKEGQRYVKLQLQRQITYREWAEGKSDVSRMLPGYTFTLTEHPRSDVNRRWWLVSVSHEGEQPGVLENEAPSERGFMYSSTFTAIPASTRFVPEIKHRKVRIDAVQSAIVTGPHGEEVYTDEFGRVKVQFHWDRLGALNENTTCWVRVSTEHAGNNFGSITLPRIGQEVLVEFLEGDPDRPLVTGRGYNRHKMPPWQLPEQKTLTGFQTREFRGVQRNQIVFDDTSGQVQASFSSDHGTAQLNLGYLTRINHWEGRKDFRGEGFELRSDHWGVLRASRGMHITTYGRDGAEQHQKSMGEAIGDLKAAVRQHKDTAELAEICHARNFNDGVQSIVSSLKLQQEDIEGAGGLHPELRQPHLVLSSPAGIATTTPESTHIHAGEHVAITSEQQTTVSSGKNFLVSAKEMVGIFACKLGMRLMASKGKVEIEAQSDDMVIIADKDMQVFSSQGKVHLSSPKEILLTAGGSYIKINADGIEQGTEGEWKALATNHNMQGPASQPWMNKEWKDGVAPPNARVVIRDELGKVLAVERYATGESEMIDPTSTEHALHLVNNPDQEEPSFVHMETDGTKQVISTFGSTVNLTADRKRDAQTTDGKE